MLGTASATARTIAYPMRWVKLTLPWPDRARYPLTTLRLTSSSLAGTLRKLVAVGTSRLAAMFFTMTAPTPLISSPGSSAGSSAGAAAAAGAGVGGGAATGVASGDGAGGAAGVGGLAGCAAAVTER